MLAASEAISIAMRWHRRGSRRPGTTATESMLDIASSGREDQPGLLPVFPIGDQTISAEPGRKAVLGRRLFRFAQTVEPYRSKDCPRSRVERIGKDHQRRRPVYRERIDPELRRPIELLADELGCPQ